MKKNAFLTVFIALILLLATIGAAQADVIPPFGEGQIGLTAVVLCESLTLREAPNAASKAVKILQYHDLINVVKLENGWAYCVIGDAEDAPAGWVNADFIAVDPAWYRTEALTPVYAWQDTEAPKIALLEANADFLDPETFLPILKQEGNWLLVSLRGATGWIHAAKQDGERFETTIILEGIAETVRYEHIVSAALGIEMDNDYENFTRCSEAGRECFVSVYDDPAHPENYLEVTRSAQSADDAAASIGEALSKDYDILLDAYALDRAGSCIRIDASMGKGGSGTPDLLQTVYIIPAGDGCVVVTEHFSFESAEGFGRRFSYLVNTLALID